MKTTTTVSVKHPAIAFLGLKARKGVSVSASPDLYLDETWEGGSRTVYDVMKLTGEAVSIVKARWPQAPTTYVLQPGEIALETCFFRGKEVAPRVRMHPADFDRLILCCQEHEDCRACADLGRACLESKAA